MPNKLSLIISTYNAPEYLHRVLQALTKQHCTNFEAVIADDGSGTETVELIKQWQTKGLFTLKHAWHEDDGFRAAAARNNAVRQSEGDYLVFLDGDCLPPPDYIQNQIAFAERGYFVRGSRIMLKQTFTEQCFADHAEIPESKLEWIQCRLKNGVKRISPVFPLPFNPYKKPTAWYGVKTCNMSVWRDDFYAVNGFDEDYIGWGHEDADLAVRLIRSGVKRKEGRSKVPVVHLWHQENDRTELSNNERRLQNTLKGHYVVCENGLTSRAVSP